MANDAHTTLGRSFRTPAHPDVVAALGRAVFNFLSQEETLSAILDESGHLDLSRARGRMAGAKENALLALADRYRADGSIALADKLEDAAAAFSVIREEVRNVLLHAHPYSAGEDDEGNYLPGLAYTAKNGQSWRDVADHPDKILDLAERVDSLSDVLSEARMAVQSSGPPPTK